MSKQTVTLGKEIQEFDFSILFIIGQLIQKLKKKSTYYYKPILVFSRMLPCPKIHTRDFVFGNRVLRM